ncbi:imm11 family protein [Listeria booriae]|uniref:imm11 family protein n=1 Tax=Listeria booriae TaxID=1552123 RepID=UPI00162A4A94|nr:DUF1629 domain-containing protein [Listeria booriae]MBC1804919.1 hypothetical protein [Listeria booriae]
MNFYKMTIDTQGENDIVCHFKNDFGLSQNALIVGKECDSWNEGFEFYYNKEEGELATDLLANDKGWLVVSEKLRATILLFTDKVEFFKVKVLEEQSKESAGDYFVANILNTVDGLSLEDSDYITVETSKRGVVYIIKKYAVKQVKLINEHIFKLPPDYNIPLFVSQDFKDMTKDKKLTGMAFLEIKVI